jgi:dUTP pyrophosphatase
MKSKPTYERLSENASEMEDALVRMGDEDDGIWQNNIIRAICRAIYNLIIEFIRFCHKHSSPQQPPRVGEFQKVSALQFLVAAADCMGGSRDDFVSAYDGIVLPTRSTAGSAGYDIHSPLAFTLKPGETVKIPSGIRVCIDDGWWLGCLPRSSIGFKYRVMLDNTMGVIDSDYYNAENEGHIFIKLTNHGDKELAVKAGDRLVQAIFLPYGITYSDTQKTSRTGGMGSTGA